ncbi:MAG: response regulator transcription factor [bacterium]
MSTVMPSPTAGGPMGTPAAAEAGSSARKSGSRQRVLVVDDEDNVSHLVSSALRFDGFETLTADNGNSALAAVAEHQPDLVVLDVMMPGLDGYELLSRLRAAGSQVPVIFLTARDTATDQVKGLRAGADDYVVKPFSVEALLARVHAVLRRSVPEVGREGVLAVADLELDENSHEVWRAGEEVHLTSTEFELLRYLMRNERVVLSKAQILDRVWKYDFQGQSNIVELYIGYLRRKVDHVEPKLIHTVRGAGYVVKAPRK